MTKTSHFFTSAIILMEVVLLLNSGSNSLFSLRILKSGSVSHLNSSIQEDDYPIYMNNF